MELVTAIENVSKCPSAEASQAASSACDKFFEQNENVFNFPDLDENLVVAIRTGVPVAYAGENESLHSLAKILRLLSRDARIVDVLFVDQSFVLWIAHRIGWQMDDQVLNISEARTELLKVATNAAFNSAMARTNITSHEDHSMGRYISAAMHKVIFANFKFGEKLVLCMEETTLLSEMSKLLFNVWSAAEFRDAQVLDELDSVSLTQLLHSARLVLTMRLPCAKNGAIPAPALARTFAELNSHFVGLLTLAPAGHRKLLTEKDQDRSVASERPVPSDTLVPVFCLLSDLAASDEPSRRYLRTRILPPLQTSDLYRRPECGSTLRNRLTALMTQVGPVSMATAQLLYVLCGHNVQKLIRYTGFGNAAGLLAQQGLLSPQQCENSSNTGSDSEGTEEYDRLRDRINPVIGCVEEPRPNPFDSMSDEQKEYEAMKLVEHIDKMMKTGVISSATIGDDGKPKPMKHILELQKDVPESNASTDESD